MGRPERMCWTCSVLCASRLPLESECHVAENSPTHRLTDSPGDRQAKSLVNTHPNPASLESDNVYYVRFVGGFGIGFSGLGCLVAWRSIHRVSGGIAVAWSAFVSAVAGSVSSLLIVQ